MVIHKSLTNFYAGSVVKEMGYLNWNCYVIVPSSAPLFSDAILYRQLVGLLQYLTFTQLDIAFVINRVGQFMIIPQFFFFFSFLCGSSNLVLCLVEKICLSQPFCHSVGLVIHLIHLNCRSTYGFIAFLCSSPISWFANNQHTISCSSTLWQIIACWLL